MSEIASASDSHSKGLLSAELACYLSRIGEYEQAESIRTSLRSEFGDGRDGEVSIMIMCMEGILLYYRELNSGALDRLIRAKFLSQALHQKKLVAFSSAWLAHIYFNADRFMEAIGSIKDSVDNIDVADTATSCRVALVLGDIFAYSGVPQSSRRWYSYARELAVQYGDQASIGAITYNQAALNVHSLRIRSIVAGLDESEISLADASVRTANNYQQLSGTRSLKHLLSAAEIGVLMLKRDYSMARASITRVFDSEDIPDNYKFKSTLTADLALCCAKLGLAAAAEREADSVLRADLTKHSVDDQIIIYSSLKQAFESIPDNAGASRLPPELSELVKQNIEIMAMVRDAASHFSDIPISMRRR